MDCECRNISTYCRAFLEDSNNHFSKPISMAMTVYWQVNKRYQFPNYRQMDSKDCGPTCLKIIARSYKKEINIQKLRELCETTREGSTLLGISDAAEQLGFRSLGIMVSVKDLAEAPLPCILYWNKNHYVVLYKIRNHKYYISDPAYGLLIYTQEEFLKTLDWQ